MMVSYIQSNYSGFGSGVAVPGTGIHLQNRGSGFTLENGPANQVGPNKRPFHAIIPGSLMRDGSPLMSFDAMGGPMQAQGHVQIVVRTQLNGQNPQAASDAPRWRFVKGKTLAVEWTMAAETVAELEALGHEVMPESPDENIAFYIGILPSTVQSSIAFTALAKGNVAASVCAAAVSNLLGVILTPLLATLILRPATAASIPLRLLTLPSRSCCPSAWASCAGR